MDIDSIGEVNNELQIITYRKWKIYRIAPGVFYYRKSSYVVPMAGMTSEREAYETEKHALYAAMNDIDRMEAIEAEAKTKGAK